MTKLSPNLCRFALPLALLAASTAAGCGSEPAAPQAPAPAEPAPEPATDKAAAAEAAATADPAPELVTVGAQGTKFDPPVAPEQIPSGAWMCEMGTVHYASTDKGDGKCPLCGMALTQKQGSDAPATGEHPAH